MDKYVHTVFGCYTFMMQRSSFDAEKCFSCLAFQNAEPAYNNHIVFSDGCKANHLLMFPDIHKYFK